MVLASDIADPARRIKAIYAYTQGAKEMAKALTANQIMGYTETTPPGLLALASRAYAASGIGSNIAPMNVVISNVPGPKTTHYWNGAQLTGTYPLSIPINGMALNITCTSYDGQMAFGLTGCRRTVPHLQRLLTYLDDEVAALEKAAGV